MPFAPSSVQRCPLLLVASLLLVAMPFASSSVLAPSSSDALFAPSSVQRCPLLLVASLLLVAMPLAPSSVLAPSSDVLCS